MAQKIYGKCTVCEAVCHDMSFMDTERPYLICFKCEDDMHDAKLEAHEFSHLFKDGCDCDEDER